MDTYGIGCPIDAASAVWLLLATCVFEYTEEASCVLPMDVGDVKRYQEIHDASYWYLSSRKSVYSFLLSISAGILLPLAMLFTKGEAGKTGHPSDNLRWQID